jgi:hypothetical protein
MCLAFTFVGKSSEIVASSKPPDADFRKISDNKIGYRGRRSYF